jgi:hypothetical protein
MSVSKPRPDILIINNEDLGTTAAPTQTGVRIKNHKIGYNRRTAGTAAGAIPPNAEAQIGEVVVGQATNMARLVESFVIGKGYRYDSANSYGVAGPNHHHYGGNNNINVYDRNHTHQIGPIQSSQIRNVGVIPCTPEMTQRVYVGAQMGTVTGFTATDPLFTTRWANGLPGRATTEQTNIFVPQDQSPTVGPTDRRVRYTMHLYTPNMGAFDKVPFSTSFTSVAHYRPDENRWTTLQRTLQDIANQINLEFTGINGFGFKYRAYVLGATNTTALAPGTAATNVPCLVIEGDTYRDTFRLEFPRSAESNTNNINLNIEDYYDNGFLLNYPDEMLTIQNGRGMSLFTVPVTRFPGQNGVAADFLPDAGGRLWGHYLDAGAPATSVVAYNGSDGGVAYEGSTSQIAELERKSKWESNYVADIHHRRSAKDILEVRPERGYSAIIIDHVEHFPGTYFENTYLKQSIIAFECQSFGDADCTSNVISGTNASLYGVIAALRQVFQLTHVNFTSITVYDENETSDSFTPTATSATDVTDRYGRVITNFWGPATDCYPA